LTTSLPERVPWRQNQYLPLVAYLLYVRLYEDNV